MTEFEELINSNDSSEFFIRLCRFLGKKRYSMPQELRAGEYEGASCLSLRVDQTVFYYRGETLVMAPVKGAHKFILTDTGALIWLLAGEEAPIRGLEQIRKRLQELWQSWESKQSASTTTNQLSGYSKP